MTSILSSRPVGPSPGAEAQSIADAVRLGLGARPKTLPPYLFYDEAGSRLYERITRLPEYYLTRAERRILTAHAHDLVDHVLHVSEARDPLTVIELGAGSASKTEILLRAVLARRSRCTYIPIDVSPTALAAARARLGAALPAVEVRPLATTYEKALRSLEATPPPRLVLFLGSSIGNLPDTEASALLQAVRRSFASETWLVLGTDLLKSPDVLRAAYDDAAGITAAFNANLLTRINRELGGHFDLDRFRHLARWNDEASRIEMHLRSTVAHDVAVDALGTRFHFDAGETIHTESSVKYDIPRVEKILTAGGFALQASFEDREVAFAVHVAVTRAAPERPTNEPNQRR
jgi:dimethylhistidine N-methyltransferase